MQVLSVSQVASRLRELLETDLLFADLWVSGEVSGPRTQPSGHTYFVLKDEGAQLRGVFFRPNLPRQRLMTDHLAHGAQVIVHGRLSLYEARGELQIVVDFIQPEGVGLRHAQFERLRAQLEEEGLFDPARKRPLPLFPRRIGVVTSPAGAVFHDICNILGRRWPLAEVVLAPTPVQGPEATLGVVNAIAALNALGDIDVVIVARGGGSIEELWAFNEEPVARAVFGSLVPIVSAVGHETDVTICDYTADVRASTPSEAAEMVAPDRAQVARELGSALGAALMGARGAIARDRAAVGSALSRGERGLPDPARLGQRVEDLDRRAHAAAAGTQGRWREKLRSCDLQLAALDPQATLNRGYAVVHRDGGVVSSIAQVSVGDGLVVKVADGGFPARVDAPASRRPRRRRATPAVNGAERPREPGVQRALFP